jgi:hypothetical protein
MKYLMIDGDRIPICDRCGGIMWMAEKGQTRHKRVKCPDFPDLPEEDDVVMEVKEE